MSTLWFDGGGMAVTRLLPRLKVPNFTQCPKEKPRFAIILMSAYVCYFQWVLDSRCSGESGGVKQTGPAEQRTTEPAGRGRKRPRWRQLAMYLDIESRESGM